MPQGQKTHGTFPNKRNGKGSHQVHGTIAPDDTRTLSLVSCCTLKWPDFRVGKSYYNLPRKNPGAGFVMKNRTILGSAFSEAHISEARTQLQRSFELGNWAREGSMMIVCLGLCDVGLGL